MKQVALVTGGSRSIGYGIVKHFAMQGLDIAINGVRPGKAVADVIESIRTSGVKEKIRHFDRTRAMCSKTLGISG